MLDCLNSIRELYWSELCNTDIVAYREFLISVKNGLSVVAAGDDYGCARLDRCDCCRFDNDDGVKFTPVVCNSARSDPLVGGSAFISDSLGSKDNVDSRAGAGQLVLCRSRISVGSFGGRECGNIGGGVGEDLQSSDGKPAPNSSTNGGSVEVGKNYKKNQATRLRKREKRAAAVHAAGQGLWSSCSEESRRKLAESRAEALVLENELRAKLLTDKIRSYDSDYGLARRVVSMVRDSSDDEVAPVRRWASSLARKSAETLASSVSDFPYCATDWRAGSQCASEEEEKKKKEYVKKKNGFRSTKRRDSFQRARVSSRRSDGSGAVRYGGYENGFSSFDSIDHRRRAANGGYDYVDDNSE